MRLEILTLGAFAAVAAAVAKPGLPKPDKDGRYTISAPGIRAKVCSILTSCGFNSYFHCLVHHIK